MVIHREPLRVPQSYPPLPFLILYLYNSASDHSARIPTTTLFQYSRASSSHLSRIFRKPERSYRVNPKCGCTARRTLPAGRSGVNSHNLLDNTYALSSADSTMIKNDKFSILSRYTHSGSMNMFVCLITGC